MDELLQLQFPGVPDLDGYCIDGSFEDVPLSNELLDDFGMDSYQAIAPGTDSITSNNHPSYRTHSDASERSLERSSSHLNAQQYQSFMAQPERTFRADFQNHDQKTPTGTPTSTQMPITPKAVNNTLSTSISANSHSSPISRPQHSVRHPSNLRNQIHPETSQYSPSVTAVAKDCNTSELSHTMSSEPKSNLRQEPKSSPSHQNTRSSSDETQFCRVTSVHNQSRGSPVLQNHQPFEESSLRSSGLPVPGKNFWDAGHLQTAQYPDPRLFYTNHHFVSEPQTTYIPSYSSVQYHMQSNDSEHASSVRQGSADFSFNGSSPLGTKRELSSSDSDRVVSSPILGSLLASPMSQKKRRVKQEPKKGGDNEGTVDSIALQTADLTNLNPIDHANIVALISAMHNTDNVEDNEGMQKTWEKVRKVKAFRIKEVCVDLLVS